MTTAPVELTQRERQVVEAIADRRDLMWQQLVDHVAIPTGLNHQPGLAAYRALIRERLEAIGADIELVPGDPKPDWLNLPGTDPSMSETAIPPTLLARHIADEKLPRVLIVGHLDTVHDPEGPFQHLEISQDNPKLATGPGAVDMKGGVQLAITALEVLHEQDIACNWTVLLNSDEERGSFHSERILRQAAQKHDVGIVLEPALPDGALAIERMGSGQFKVETFGRSAHVGREFKKGVSAVTALAHVLLKLAELARPDDGMIVSVGPLRGNKATNAVPDHAEAWGNVRYASPAKGEELGKLLDALATDENAMPRIVVHRHWNRPAKPLTEQVQKFAEHVRDIAEALGQTLPFERTGGVCDGNILQQVGLPTLDTLGIRGGNLHRLDEFIEVDSLVERCQLLAVVLSRIARSELDIS